MGESLGEFDKRPSDAEVGTAIKAEGGNPNAGYESKKGSVLDNNVKSGKYVLMQIIIRILPLLMFNK